MMLVFTIRAGIYIMIHAGIYLLSMLVLTVHAVVFTIHAGIYDSCWYYFMKCQYEVPFVSKLKMMLVFTIHAGIYLHFMLVFTIPA